LQYNGTNFYICDYRENPNATHRIGRAGAMICTTFGYRTVYTAVCKHRLNFNASVISRRVIKKIDFCGHNRLHCEVIKLICIYIKVIE
jgi:hypothetical protein